MIEKLLYVFDLGLTIAILDSLGGGEGEHLAAVANARDKDVGVDHSLGDVGTTAARLSGSAHKRAHIALVFVGLHLPGLVDHGSRADRGAAVHVDRVASDGDESAGRGRVVVDEGIHRHGRLEESRADFVGVVEGSAEGVDMHDDDVGLKIFSLLHSLFDAEGCRGSDFLVDIEAVDLLRIVLSHGSQRHQHGSQKERQ